MTLNEIALALDLSHATSTPVASVAIDSRLVGPGCLFVAFAGEHFDGHDFVQEAEKKGAVAALVTKEIPGVSIPQIVVDDTLSALTTLAKANRSSIRCPIIALTGSNGKTTVKEMIASILPSPSHATKGNLNNHIGAPLSVMGLKPLHLYAVFELGASNPGEIAHTVAVVKPDVALINNIAPAHVEGFGSVEGVAKTKGEIYQGLTQVGTAVVNDDDDYAHFWDDILQHKKVLRFSMNHEADIYAKNVTLNEKGFGCFTLMLPNKESIAIELQAPGLHNVRNALAAAACCFAVGLSSNVIAEGLCRFTGVKGRLTRLIGKNNATILDDSYNANLRSVVAGLEYLATFSGDKVFVFGDMKELGAFVDDCHTEVGVIARKLGINQLYTCGAHSALASNAFGEGGQHFKSQDDLVAFLSNKLKDNTTVLVKGSRSSAMEKIVQKLLN